MLKNFEIETASTTDRGLSEKRPQNEDSFLEVPACGIFAVADGVGGAQAGEVASQMAVEVLGEAFANFRAGDDAEVVMEKALSQANTAIHQMSSELPQLSQMATTIVALHLNNDIATIGHVGDSRLYRLAGGSLSRETEDHSMVAEEVRAGRMTEEQAENHPGKNIISRALGAESEVAIDLKTMMITADMCFLLCSDGVTRHINDTELTSILNSGMSADEQCRSIKDLCFERGAEDNLTAVIVNLTSNPDNTNDTEHHVTEDIVVKPIDDDTPTISTARSQFETADTMALDDDDLLEIAERATSSGNGVNDPLDILDILNVLGVPDAETEFHTGPATTVESELVGGETIVVEEPIRSQPAKDVVSVEDANETITQSQTFTIFGHDDSESETAGNGSASAIGKIVRSVGLLLIGSLFGLAGYHFLIAERSAPIESPPLEMKSSNLPQSAFEENRRTVDKDPENAIRVFSTEPKDAENTYLLGRAYLLTGDFPNARTAFKGSRELIDSGDVDSGNAETIRKDIIIAMALTDNPLSQTLLKEGLGSSNIPAANSNSNR